MLCERPVSMTTNGSAAVAVEAATAERILHKLRDKGRRERGAECAGNGTKGQRWWSPLSLPRGLGLTCRGKKLKVTLRRPIPSDLMRDDYTPLLCRASMCDV